MMPLSWFAMQTIAGQRWSGLLPIHIEHAYEMGTSELHLNQHHVGGHSADHGPKYAPGMISSEARSESKPAKRATKIKPATTPQDAHAEKRLTWTSPLPKFRP